MVSSWAIGVVGCSSALLGGRRSTWRRQVRGKKLYKRKTQRDDCRPGRRAPSSGPGVCQGMAWKHPPRVGPDPGRAQGGWGVLLLGPCHGRTGGGVLSADGEGPRAHRRDAPAVVPGLRAIFLPAQASGRGICAHVGAVIYHSAQSLQQGRGSSTCPLCLPLSQAPPQLLEALGQWDTGGRGLCLVQESPRALSMSSASLWLLRLASSLTRPGSH